MNRLNLLRTKNVNTFDEFDLSEDIERLLRNNNNDVTADESDDDDDRPASRMQFYSSSDSESEYPSSSPDTVITNDKDFIEDHLDDSLPDLIPIDAKDVDSSEYSEEFYYEASVVVHNKNVAVSVDDEATDIYDIIDAFNDNNKFPKIYEVMKSINVAPNRVSYCNFVYKTNAKINTLQILIWRHVQRDLDHK